MAPIIDAIALAEGAHSKAEQREILQAVVDLIPLAEEATNSLGDALRSRLPAEPERMGGPLLK
jgi:hypothetical protein